MTTQAKGGKTPLKMIIALPGILLFWAMMEGASYSIDFENSILLSTLIFCLSMFVLTISANEFTERSVELGDGLGLSHLATGALIISIGTSAPEIFSSVGAIVNDQPSLIIGNVYGTIIANTLLGIGLASILATKPIAVHSEVVGTHSVVFLGACFLTIFCLYDGALGYIDSIAVFICFFMYVSMCAKDRDVEASQNVGQGALVLPLAVGILCLLILFRSGDVVVASMISSAVLLGLPEIKVATTVLAIGTSIPEIVSAIVLSIKGRVDSLFGEIIGSNLIALLGIFGFAGFFAGVALSGPILIFLLVSVAVTGIITFVMMSDSKIIRIEGSILVLMFVVWVSILVGLKV